MEYFFGGWRFEKRIALYEKKPPLVWGEFERKEHLALSKQPISKFKPVQQSRQLEHRAYCPNVYTVPGTYPEPKLGIFHLAQQLQNWPWL